MGKICESMGMKSLGGLKSNMAKRQKATKEDLPLISKQFFIREFSQKESREINKAYLKRVNYGHNSAFVTNSNARLDAINNMSKFYSWAKDRSYGIKRDNNIRYDEMIIPIKNNQVMIKYLVSEECYNRKLTEGVVLISNKFEGIEIMVNKLLELKFEKLSSKKFKEQIHNRRIN